MAHQTAHTSNHPTFKQYVYIAAFLFAITIVEFLLIWEPARIDQHLGASKIPLLIALSAVKFYFVIMFYMHLSFDNRFFKWTFIAGLTLAFLVGIALIGLFSGFNGDHREYAEARAIPYEHVEDSQEKHGSDATATAVADNEKPITKGPITLHVGVVGDALTFDKPTLTATSGSEVTIEVANPSTTNTHNLVIVEAGTKDAVATSGTAAGPANDWVEPGDSRVIANTPLFGPGVTGEVTFTAPPPGTYQFVCTFPGHNFTMFGDFIVQ